MNLQSLLFLTILGSLAVFVAGQCVPGDGVPYLAVVTASCTRFAAACELNSNFGLGSGTPGQCCCGIQDCLRLLPGLITQAASLVPLLSGGCCACVAL